MLETVEDPWVSLTVIIYRPELMPEDVISSVATNPTALSLSDSH